MSGAARAPSDAALTDEGWAALGGPGGAAAGRVAVIACGALAREILAIRRLNALDPFDLFCLPALLHNRPEQITPRVAAAIKEARAAGYTAIRIAYADCGTGGALQRLAAAEGVEMIDAPHCYSFFDGVETFAARGDAEMTAFFLTDFLARQFDALVWRGLGLDRAPELRTVYFAHYERVVHLAQTEDEAVDAAARAAARRLDLAFERRYTGYGDLERFLIRGA